MIQKEVMQENLTQKDITRKGGIPETEICGAIFDLDGVLLDSMAVWNDLGVRYLQKRGIQTGSWFESDPVFHEYGAGCGLFERTVSASGYISGNFKWN